MESTSLFEEKVPLIPRDLSREVVNIDAIILKKLATKLEGKCSLHGWVKPQSVKILGRSMGYVETGRFTGDVVFHVQAEGRTLNPPSGIIVAGDVIRKNKMGMYVSYEDAIQIILPRDLHIGDDLYDAVQIGERVSVIIKKSRFQVADQFILSVGIFNGREGAEYTKTTNVATEEMPILEPDVPLVLEEDTVAEETAAPVEETTAPTEEADVAREEVDVPTGGAAAETSVIEFYSKTPEYRELSNLFPSPFEIDGKTWQSVEHYFQAMKFASNPEYQEQIRLAKTPTTAKQLGSTKEKPIRADWDSYREEVMKKAVRAKFTQNEALKKLLLETGDRPLVEANPTDSYWGYGRTKQGKNRMGILLMELRSVLRAEQEKD